MLDLVAAARPAPGELPWLAELALPDAAGGWAPAGELVLPGSELAAVLAEGALGTLHPETAAACDPDALRAVGVLDTFALVRGEDPDDLDVDGADAWADAVLDRLPPDAPPPAWPPLTAVRDLELVRDWRRALPLLAAAPPRRGPTCCSAGWRCRRYLRWWLSVHPVLDGRRPDRLRHPDGTELQGLYEPATGAARRPRPAAPAGHRRRRARRRRRRDRPARPPRRPGPHGAAGGAADGLRPAGRGPRRRSTSTRRTGSGSRRTGWSEDAVVLDAPYLQPLVDEPRGAGGRRARRRGRPARPAAGGREGARFGDRRADGGSRWAELPGAGLAAARLGRRPARRARWPCTTS